VRRELRAARATEALAWITSHSFRKTAATNLDEEALSARRLACGLCACLGSVDA